MYTRIHACPLTSHTHTHRDHTLTQPHRLLETPRCSHTDCPCGQRPSVAVDEASSAQTPTTLTTTSHPPPPPPPMATAFTSCRGHRHGQTQPDTASGAVCVDSDSRWQATRPARLTPTLTTASHPPPPPMAVAFITSWW